MDEAVEDAAYRGTLRALSTVAFVLAALGVPFSLLGTLGSGAAAVGALLLGPLTLVVLGLVLRALSGSPRVDQATLERARDVV